MAKLIIASKHELLLKHTITEVERLREHASAEQKKNLKPNMVDEGCPSMCIYGHMTGYCESREAHQLMKVCVPKYINTYSGKIIPKSLVSFRSNNNPHLGMRSGKIPNNDNYFGVFTPIEYFIIEYPSTKANIAKYIKGTTDKLVLKKAIVK